MVAPIIEILIPADSEQNNFFTQKLQSIRVNTESTSTPLTALIDRGISLHITVCRGTTAMIDCGIRQTQHRLLQVLNQK